MTKRIVTIPGQDPSTQPNEPEQAAGQGDDGAGQAQGSTSVDAFQARVTEQGESTQIDALAAQQAQIDALTQQVQALLAAGLRTAQAQSAAPVQLPHIEDKAVRASAVPVLTQQGWFVPESKVWAVTAGKGS